MLHILWKFGINILILIRCLGFRVEVKKIVNFSVYLDDEDVESPNLDGFGYNEHCNKEGNHVKGVGSIHLLNVSMQFILSHYNLPSDTQFQFKDTSFIECKSYKMSRLSFQRSFQRSFQNGRW